MIVRVGCLLVALLAGGAETSFAESSTPTIDGLPTLVLKYLDTESGDEAERLLQAIHSHRDVSVNAVSQVIRAERVYQNQPVGNLRNEQIVIRGQTYPLSLFVPPTYQASRAYALVVCLHGFGFTGEEYLERWRK